MSLGFSEFLEKQGDVMRYPEHGPRRSAQGAGAAGDLPAGTVAGFSVGSARDRAEVSVPAERPPPPSHNPRISDRTLHR